MGLVGTAIEYTLYATMALLLFTAVVFAVDALVYAALLLNVDLANEQTKPNPAAMTNATDDHVDDVARTITTDGRNSTRTTNEIRVPVALTDQTRLCRVPRRVDLNPTTRRENVSQLADLFPMYVRCAVNTSWKAAASVDSAEDGQ